MVDKPVITYADFGRLLTEHYQSLNADTWFRDHGFEEQAEQALVRAAVAIYPRLMLEGMLSGDDEGETLDNVAATLMVAGFALGWEFHKQIGEVTDDALGS